MSDQVSRVFMLIADLSLAMGVSDINQLPACHEMTVGAFFVAVNAHGDKRKCSRGVAVPAFHAYVERNGWPVGIFNPRDGEMTAGTEDELIAALCAEVERVTGKASDYAIDALVAGGRK